MPTHMTASTPTSQPIIEPTAQHADTLHVDYALKVRGREHTVCEIDGSAHMPYALHADTRRDTAANFNRLMGLLLLQPALLQVNGYINGLRRADIETREAGQPVGSRNGVETQSSDPLESFPGTIPEAGDPEPPPHLTPEPPLKTLTA